MKCSKCKKKAEFFLPDEKGKAKTYFCEDHAIEYLKEGERGFLPRVE